MRLINTAIKNSGLLAIIVAAMMVVGGGSAIAGSMITGKQVKNSSLTGADIKNKSLSVSDISQKSRDALKGNVGPTGATGLTGSHGPMVERFASGTSEVSSTTATPVFENVEINVPEGSSKLLIHFNAECSISDPAAYRTQYVHIRVDGNIVQNSAATCSNTSDYAAFRPQSTSIQRWVNVTPGVHTVTVNHWVSNNAATGRLVDKTLTVTAAN